jgi:GTPase Era involved in 16S rRNA processing
MRQHVFYRKKGARIKEGSMVPRDIRKHVFIGKKGPRIKNTF